MFLKYGITKKAFIVERELFYFRLFLVIKHISRGWEIINAVGIQSFFELLCQNTHDEACQQLVYIKYKSALVPKENIFP